MSAFKEYVTSTAFQTRRLNSETLARLRITTGLSALEQDALYDLDVANQRLDECKSVFEELIAVRHEREHWRQRTLEAEQKLQAMTESREFWKQMVKDGAATCIY